MWPVLQQPWYFSTSCIAADDRGFVYVGGWRGSEHIYVWKFTIDGQFVVNWGGSIGSGDGEFHGITKIATDSDGNVYVADETDRIQKFTANGKFLTVWGSDGSGGVQVDSVDDLAIDSHDNVYVVNGGKVWKFTVDGQFLAELPEAGAIAIGSLDRVYLADRVNHRIRRFDSNFNFEILWGTKGWGPGEFQSIECIAVSKDGHVFVGDKEEDGGVDKADVVKEFDADGQFVREWNIYRASTVAVGPHGNVFVHGSNGGISKYTPNGEWLTEWTSFSAEAGRFNGGPSGLMVDSSDAVWAADAWNDRIQVFNAEGQLDFIWKTSHFLTPYKIARDSLGNIHVLDRHSLTDRDHVVMFDSNRAFLGTWGPAGMGDGQIWSPVDLVIDSQNNKYVADMWNSRIHKFDSNGQYVSVWLTYPDISTPKVLAIDSQDNIYVADMSGDAGAGRVRKFNPQGDLVLEYCPECSDLTFVAVDNQDNVFAWDNGQQALLKFGDDGSQVNEIGSPGHAPGHFLGVYCMAFASDGRFFVGDSRANRVQAFEKLAVDPNTKAIVLAGGGSYTGNMLWGATQTCANFAYWVLNYQGIPKERITYLTSDTEVDLDGNNVWDDAIAATKDNLEDAITSWASNANTLILYLADHGGDGSFRVNETEILYAAELQTWLNTLQDMPSFSGQVIVIIDSCDSGTFQNALVPLSGKKRIVMTSTSPGESAYFVGQGSVSFSNYFWSRIFQGDSVQTSFDEAKDAMEYVTTSGATHFQTPILTAHNTSADTYIGNGTAGQGGPEMAAVGVENISANSATIYADGVSDSDGIARVWAMIKPPTDTQGAAANPVGQLPAVDLLPVGGDRYEKTYDGFNFDGPYDIVVYARDRIGNTSLPHLATVKLNDALTRKAIVVAASSKADHLADPLWPAVKKGAELAFGAMRFQGYKKDDIYYMSPEPSMEGWDAPASRTNLQFAIATWCQLQGPIQDLVLYMVGPGSFGSYQLNEDETVSGGDVAGWVGTLPDSVRVTVIYDADYSGSFLPELTPPAGKERIVMSSATALQPTHFISEGDISFSRFFWRHVLHGIKVRKAFSLAKNAVQYACEGQTPQFDDNGNGIGNESTDGLLAGSYTIGAGISLVGNDPLIGSVSPDVTLPPGSASSAIWAEQVTSTGAVDTVWAVITLPRYLVNLPGHEGTELTTTELVFNGSSQRYEGSFEHFDNFGTYTVTVYAKDTEGNLSLLKEISVFRPDGPDIYEDDDMVGAAGIIIPDLNTAQRHNFHDTGDQDLVKFYGIAHETYEIKAGNLEADCSPVIALLDTNGTATLGSTTGTAPLSWECPADGIYFVMVEQSNPAIFGENTGYDLSVYRPVAGEPGTVTGYVFNEALEGIRGARVRVSVVTTLSLKSGYFSMTVPSGTWPITVEATGYESPAGDTVTVQSHNETTKVLLMSPGSQPKYPGDLDGDDDVDGSDLAICADEYGNDDCFSTPCQCDIDNDGSVNEADLDLLSQDLGKK